jgi:peptidyl-tRNA hydrolase, PTH1 family
VEKSEGSPPSSSVPIRWVAGLGNPPGAYRYTPHNIGFHVVDVLAAGRDWAWRDYDGFSAASASGRELVLVKPLTYMNTSGPAVKAAGARFRVSREQLLVVCDDFALPWGRLRFRRSGSAGGHNGLASLIEAMGGPAFPRLRIGIGPVPSGADPKDYVLKKQPKDRMEALARSAAEALDAALREGLEAAMNRFNAAPAAPEDEA